MYMEIEIISWTKKDLTLCISFCKQSWSEWWDNNYILATEHIERAITHQHILIAKKDGVGIGYLLRGILRNKLHIQDIFILPEYRNLHCGKSLLEQLISIGKEWRYDEIISDCDVSNADSLSFHLKCWFSCCWTIKEYWDEEDSHVLSLKL